MDLCLELGSVCGGNYGITVRCRGADLQATSDTGMFVKAVVSTASGASLPLLGDDPPQLSAAERVGNFLGDLHDEQADISEWVQKLRRVQVSLASLAYTEPSACEAAICAAEGLRVAAVLRPCGGNTRLASCQPYLEDLAEWACAPLGVAYIFEEAAPARPAAVAMCGALTTTCTAAVAFARIVEAVLATPEPVKLNNFRETLCIENWPADVMDKYATANRCARLEASKKSIREDFKVGEEMVRHLSMYTSCL